MQPLRASAVALVLLATPLAAHAQALSDVEAALASGDAAGAAALFAEIEAAGASVDDYRGYATRLFRAGRTADAIGVLERAIDAHPGEPRFRYMLGTLHRNEGRCTEAIAALEPFVRAVPDDPDGHAGLARCYERVGRGPEAIVAWERYLAAETRSDRAELREEADASLARLRGGGDDDSAPAAFADVSSPAPSSSASPASSPAAPATAARAAGSGAPAASPFADLVAAPAPVAASSAPVSAPAQAAETGAFTDATAAIEAGDAAAAARDWEAARAAWEAAAALAPSDAAAHYRAGVGAAVLGDAEAAAAAFRRAEGLAPAFTVARERALQAEALVAHEQSIALDRAGFATDAGTRQVAAVEAYAAGRWLDGVRAQLVDDRQLDPLVVALRARVEARPTELADSARGAVAMRPDDTVRLVEAADLLRLAGDLASARYLLGVYSDLGGEASARFLAVRSAIERASELNRATP